MIQHVVSVSGGKDSTATYCKAVESGRPFRAVAADTDNEHPVTYEAIQRLHEYTGGPKVEIVKANFAGRIERKRAYIAAHWQNDGVPEDLVRRALDILHPTGNAYLDMCLWKGRFPSRKAQFCTEALKIEPIEQKIIRPLLGKGVTVLSWQGVRRAESVERSLLPRRQRLAHHDDLPGRLYVFRPLLHVRTIEEVFAIGDRHGVPRNPLYGWGLRRVGCFPCINCAKSEIALLDRFFPEQIERLEAWEALVSDASKRGSATFFNLINDPVMAEEWAARGRGSDVPRALHKEFGVRRMVQWAKTDRGGRQYSLFGQDLSLACNQWGACE